MTYYYFGASLPTLSLQGKVPFTVAEFLEDAHRLLSKEDAVLVTKILNAETVETRSQVVARIFEFERSLNNHIASYRAQKANKDPQSHVRGEHVETPHLSQLVKEAANASDPLEGEKIISKARWRFYEELAAGEFYTLAYILLFGLKLKIVERYHDIGLPLGRERYEQLKKIEFPEEMFSNV